MNLVNSIGIATCAAAAMLAGSAFAQKAQTVPGQFFYYESYEAALPGDGGTTSLALNGMKSVHAVWIAFTGYAGSAKVNDAPVITLLEGMKIKWPAPKGCAYELELANANPPAVNLIKPSSTCALNTDLKPVFKIIAL